MDEGTTETVMNCKGCTHEECRVSDYPCYECHDYSHYSPAWDREE